MTDPAATRTLNGTPMFWLGHQVERLGKRGGYKFKALCGASMPHAYTSRGDADLRCMSCALILDQEKLAALEEDRSP